MVDKNVLHPNHYQLSCGVEVMDVIKSVLTPEQFTGFLKGNAIKYLLRAGRKGGEVEDLKKMATYNDLLIEELEDDNAEITD